MESIYPLCNSPVFNNWIACFTSKQKRVRIYFCENIKSFIHSFIHSNNRSFVRSLEYDSNEFYILGICSRSIHLVVVNNNLFLGTCNRVAEWFVKKIQRKIRSHWNCGKIYTHNWRQRVPPNWAYWSCFVLYWGFSIYLFGLCSILIIHFGLCTRMIIIEEHDLIEIFLFIPESTLLISESTSLLRAMCNTSI